MGMTRARKKRTRGMAMVEMIFVLPLLLILVFGIAEFGLMFSRWLTLSNAVREGARNGTNYRVSPSGNQCPGKKSAIENEVKNTVVEYANAGGVPINTGDVNVTGICDPSGDPVEVSASYDFKVNIPFASLNTIPIAYKSKMRNE